jgi:hypothetical protein
VASAASGPGFDDPGFDDLGWAQFERLCDEVFRLEGVEPAWQGRADVGRVAWIDGHAIAGLWVKPAVRAGLMRRALLARVAETVREESASRPLRLLTNLDLTPEEAREVGATAGYSGPKELIALIAREPLLRRRVPSVLGVSDLDALVPQPAADASTGDVAAARALAAVFVPTGAYDRALAALERNRFAVLTGPPEMGKTAIARTIGLAVLTEGWELHECVRPEEIWTRLAHDRPQLFVADDAFGSTEYQPEAAERWALDLDRILRALDDRHWLVWTSRPAPLQAALRRVHREHGVARWPQPAQVEVAADRLDVEEKALILYRHARGARVPAPAADVVRRHGHELVSHAHFTPERIRRFVAQRLPKLAAEPNAPRSVLSAAIELELRDPTEAMAASLRALDAEYRTLLVALLDTPPGPVPERELAAAARRHLEHGLAKPPSELVDRLRDHFLRIVPPHSVTWVHPSWRDLVIDDLGADTDARRRFLERCSIDGVLLALATGGGATGERVVPLLVEDADWDALAARLHELAGDLDSGGEAQLLAALAAAVEADLGEDVERELEALLREVLDLLRRRWDARRAVIEPVVLELWLRAAAALDERPHPELRWTWLELAPAAAPDVDSPADVDAFADWLHLAAALRRWAPALADERGFPAHYLALLETFVGRAGAAASRGSPPRSTPMLARALDLLRRAAPAVATAAREDAAARLASTLELPGDVPRPRRRRRGVEPPSIVDRILDDLG